MDLDDKEHPRKRPVPVSDRVRLTLKVGATAAAAIWARTRMSDHEHEGAAVAVAAGIVMIVIAVVDLVALSWSTQADRIFFSARWHVALLLVALGTGGIVLVGLGLAKGA